MKKLVFLGNGGQNRAALPYIDKKIYDYVGSYDDNGGTLGNIDEFFKDINNYDAVFIAIGNNGFRRKLFEKCGDNIEVINIIANTAKIIDQKSIKGKGIFIGNGGYIGPNAIIEDCVIVNTSGIVEHDCIVEKFAQISPNSTLCGAVEIGENVFIGASATIIPCIKVCKDAIIGAGSVVIKNIEKPGTFVGNPAQLKGMK